MNQYIKLQITNYELRYIFVFFLLLFVGCETINNKSDRCAEDEIKINLVTDNIENNFCVEVADNVSERAQGLMGKEKLGQDEGMLFVFDSEDYQSFWMKNTLIPLDLLFFDKDGKLVDFKDNFQPCQSEVCESYVSRQKVKYVLEIGSDRLDANVDYVLKMD